MTDAPLINLLRKRKPLLVQEKPVRDMILRNTEKVLSAHKICAKAIDVAVSETVSVPAKAAGEELVRKVRKLRNKG